MKKRELIFFAALATFLSANAQEKQIWSLDINNREVNVQFIGRFNA